MPIHDSHCRATAETATQAGGEQRPHQLQGAAAGGLHDAGTDRHRAQASLGRRCSRGFPVGDHVGEEALAMRSVLVEQGVATVESVVPDRRSRHERPRATGAARGHLGQLAGRLDPAFADRGAVRVGEPTRDRGTGQVHDGVDTVQQVRSGGVGVPLSFVRVSGRAPDQPDHAVPAGGQQRGERRAHQAGSAGDRDRAGRQPRLGGIAVRGQIVGQLAMPVDERRTQGGGGHRRIDAVVNPGGSRPLGAEFVCVTPPSDDPGRPGSHAVRRQFVDEPVRRVVGRAVVLRHPQQARGQAEHGATVGQRRSLGHDRHRLPRWHQPRHRARAGVPGEHLVQRMVHDALVLDSHDSHS